jgi:TatD DNase family protein
MPASESARPAGPRPALVDTHCHLAFSAFDEDRQDVLGRAREAGLVGCVAVAVDGPSARRARALAESQPGFVYPTAGLHPTEDQVGEVAALDEVADLLDSGDFVAVGETGLDDYHDRAPLAVQRRSLVRHIELALDLDLPVILHCRDAFAPLTEALQPFTGAGLRGVLHCFTGDQAEIEPLLELGLHIGIGGIATYKPRRDLRDVVREIPEDRLLVETDAPWLSPQPVRGRRNEPSFVAHVAECLAGVRNVTHTHLATTTTANAAALFRVPFDAVSPRCPQ